MIIFLLVFLSSSAVYSLPAQENCDKSTDAFHDCLKDRFLELPGRYDRFPFRDENNSIDFRKWRSVFVECGAEQSECYLQKKLMQMIEKLIRLVEKMENLPDDLKLKLSDSRRNPPACFNKTSKMYKETCSKYAYDQHGLEIKAGSSLEVDCCLSNYLEKVCPTAELEILPLFPIMKEIKFYAYQLKKFYEFVEMNHHATKAKPQPPTSEVFSDECKKTENEFHDCLKNYREELSIKNESKYSIQKEVFYKCGAAESDCYLQKQLLTWLDTVIGATDEEVHATNKADYFSCTMKMFKQYGFERRRGQYDRNGFKKPRTPLEYMDAVFKAKYSRQLCSPEFTILTAKHEKYVKVLTYRYNLDRFVEYVTKSYRYMKIDEKVAREMEKFVSF